MFADHWYLSSELHLTKIYRCSVKKKREQDDNLKSNHINSVRDLIMYLEYIYIYYILLYVYI